MFFVCQTACSIAIGTADVKVPYCDLKQLLLKAYILTRFWVFLFIYIW